MLATNNFRLGNFQGEMSNKIKSAKDGSGLSEYVMNLFDASLKWEDIAWLKRFEPVSDRWKIYRSRVFIIIAFLQYYQVAARLEGSPFC